MVLVEKAIPAAGAAEIMGYCVVFKANCLTFGDQHPADRVGNQHIMVDFLSVFRSAGLSGCLCNGFAPPGEQAEDQVDEQTENEQSKWIHLRHLLLGPGGFFDALTGGGSQ